MNKENRTIFITGTNSGIGKASVEFFAKKGWNVAATVRDVQKHKNLFSEFPNVKLYSLELSNLEEISKIANDVIKDFSSVDLVVNNAGYCLYGPTETSTMDQIENQFRVNTFAPFAVIKAFTKHFREKKSGMFINISSMSAQANYPFIGAYGASKWALRGLTETLAIELAPFGIQTKAIYPGGHATKIFTKIDNGLGKKEDGIFPAYKKYYDNTNSQQVGMENATPPENIAKEIWKVYHAGDKGSDHVVSGPDAKMIMFMKKIMGAKRFKKMNIGTLLKPVADNGRFMKLIFGKKALPVELDFPTDAY